MGIEKYIHNLDQFADYSQYSHIMPWGSTLYIHIYDGPTRILVTYQGWVIRIDLYIMFWANHSRSFQHTTFSTWNYRSSLFMLHSPSYYVTVLLGILVSITILTSISFRYIEAIKERLRKFLTEIGRIIIVFVNSKQYDVFETNVRKLCIYARST